MDKGPWKHKLRVHSFNILQINLYSKGIISLLRLIGILCTSVNKKEKTFIRKIIFERVSGLTLPSAVRDDSFFFLT